jgi:hypothetical protein
MSHLENLPSSVQTSRRHLMKAGGIAASAIVASLATTRIAAGASNTGVITTTTGVITTTTGQITTTTGGLLTTTTGQILTTNNGSCFLKGTTIRTAKGDKKIEDLVVGDLLPTVFGGMRPIQWIGRYPFKRSNRAKAWVRDVLPVRVARSAVSPDVPNRDLYVTRAHALLIDGVLLPAGTLINGRTITLYDADAVDELEFFHIKLESHDVIFAEGAPCETLVEVDDTAVNFAEYLRRNQEARCAPWVGFGPRIEIKSHFRSAIAPWVDRRQKLDLIRDRLEERGIALSQQAEFV